MLMVHWQLDGTTGTTNNKENGVSDTVDTRLVLNVTVIENEQKG